MSDLKLLTLHVFVTPFGVHKYSCRIQVWEMKRNEIRLFLISRIMIRLRSLRSLHSLRTLQAYICMLGPINVLTSGFAMAMLGECMHDAWVIN